jgi:hypothetical protein
MSSGCARSATSTKTSVTRERLGESITVEGVARDAKGGAVVVVDGTPLSLAGLERWTRELDGAAVRVTGTLRERVHPPLPVGSNGERSAGAEGSELVLESPRWEKR